MKKSNFSNSLISFSKVILIVFSLSFLLTSCLGPKRLNKWVAKQYSDKSFSSMKNNTISITSKVKAVDDNLSFSKSNTTDFLPLIFYWSWSYNNICTLNPKIPITNFSSTILGNNKLKQKLNGQRIELTVENIPNTFTLVDKGHEIFFVYAYGWDVMSIKPDIKDLVVSYKLFNADNSVAKNGSITIPDSDKGVKMGMFQSVKKKTWQYLTDYDANIVSMTNSFIDKLITEL